MPFAENDGVKIYWEETGKGDPILLIMGLGWVSQMWHRTRDLLAGVKCRLLGVVLNAVDEAGIYGSGYYQGYGYVEPKAVPR